MGEHQHSSLSNRIGYYAGTGGSLAAGCFYGTTWMKGGAAVMKGSLTAFRMIKRAFTVTKGMKTFSKARQFKQLAKESELAVQQARPYILKTENLTNKTTMSSLDDFSKAGQIMDREGLTKAGRALDKHGNRPNSPFPKAVGNESTKNRQ